MSVEDTTLRPCTDHATILADRYRLGPVLRRSPGCCAHRGYDDLLQRTVTVTLLAGRGPLVLPPRSWLDRGPEVAELLDAGDVDDRLFLVTAHPAEPTLAETTPPGGLDAAQIRALGTAVADTLVPRHRQGAAHGGLGAGTVAWTPRGASLAEFGLLPWLERSGELPVAPPFPAPEREAGAAHDPAGDVYALGRLLDELAPAHRSRALRELLADMTAASPADRPTMEEVGRRLSRAREPGRARATVARSAALVATACCLVLLGVGVSAFAGSAPSAPGATLATTAAAPGPAPLLVPPADRAGDTADSTGSSDQSSTDTGSTDTGTTDGGSTEDVVLAEPPRRSVPTTPRVDTTRSALSTRDAPTTQDTPSRAAMRRDDDGDDDDRSDARPSSSTPPPTSSTPTTTTTSPTSTTPTTSPDRSSRAESTGRDRHHLLDRVVSGLVDRVDGSDRRHHRDLAQES